MNKFLIQFKQWYETCATRERIFVILLGWAVIYAIFYLSLFKSLDKQSNELKADIKKNHNQIKHWTVQIDALNNLSTTPLYKEWFAKNVSMRKLQEQYKHLLKPTTANQWQEVVKAILQAQPTIKLEHIKNLPESLYNQGNSINPASKVYQQQLELVIYSNYFDAINYLQQLERILPNIRWDTLHYEVVSYPLAKIEMEMSILYAKNS